MRSDILGEAANIVSARTVRDHLTADETAAFVDGALAGDEILFVNDHLSNCERCTLTVDDLRAFKTEIARSVDREFHPRPILDTSESWWDRTVSTLSAVFGRPPRLAFGAVVTLIVLGVTGFLIWRAQPGPEPKQEVVVSPPSNTPPAPAPTTNPVSLVAQLKDGDRQVTLDSEGKLSGADDLPTEYQSMLKEALTNQRLETSPHLTGLSRPASSLMSGDKEKNNFVVVEPVGRILLTDRPTFRWSQLDGATGYVVEVYDSNFELVASSPQLTTRSWKAPKQLGRGKVYTWQVKATKDGQEFNSPRPPEPQAKFRVIDHAKANELANARRSSSHLVLGLLYAEAGLLKEAEQELKVVQKENPESTIARSLLNKIQILQR